MNLTKLPATDLNRNSKPFGFSASGSLDILGMMSGTSGDGIDGALVRFGEDGSHLLLWHDSFDFSPEVRCRLQSLMLAVSGADLARSEAYLAELHVEAVRSFRVKHKDGIDALAVHGQTLVHVPCPIEWEGMRVSGSLQVLNPGWLAQKTGLPVISDFRRRDLAVGGQGAPLVPFGDARFFGKLLGNTVALNVGGIANVTIIAGNPGSDSRVVSAFDTGPGNMLMDAATVWASGGSLRFDQDGKLAGKAVFHQPMLDFLMGEPYLKLPPPKTTGREDFGCTRWEQIKASWEKRISSNQIISTLCEFTARTIVKALDDFVVPAWPPDRVIIAGGGANNPELVKRLQGLLPERCPLERSDLHGVPAMAREAMAFAALGEAFLRGNPANVPAATGAEKRVILGSFTPA